jgi:hypothetical protein
LTVIGIHKDQQKQSFGNLFCAWLYKDA